MKKRIGLTALLLFALVVGLMPQSAYAAEVIGVRRGAEYTKSGNYRGDFCIQLKCDDATSQGVDFAGVKVKVNDDELIWKRAGQRISGKQFTTPNLRLRYEENGEIYQDAYLIVSKDVIKDGAKIEIEIKGLQMHLLVKKSGDQLIAEPYDPATQTEDPSGNETTEDPQTQDPGAQEQPTEDPGEAQVDEQEANKAIEKAKEYLASVNEEMLALVKTDENESAIENYKNALLQLKQIVAKKEQGQTVDALDIATIQELLGRQENGDWIFKKSPIRKLAKKIVLDFKVEGERTTTDTKTGKKYPTVLPENGKIVIQCPITGLTNADNAEKRLYLNAIKKEDYKNTDATSGATPTYNKAELHSSLYSVEEGANGQYTITVRNVPEDILILKPVAKVRIAKKTNAENGDMVFVKRTETPGTTPSQPSNPSTPSRPSVPSVPSATPSSDGMTKIPAQEGEAYGYALAPAGSVDENTRVRITEKANGKRDVILVDANGNQVYSDELMLVTVPAPKEQQGSYRVKVDGVYTTFELSEDGKYVTMPMVFSRDGKRTENVVVTEGAVTVKGTKTALPGIYKLSVTDRGNARYSVNLLNHNGKQMHSNGPVMVSMPVPAGAGDVYRVKADGKWITFEVENRTVRFALVF